MSRPSQRSVAPVTASTSVRLYFPSPRPWSTPAGATRLVVEIRTEWAWVEGAWSLRHLRVTSAQPLLDGRPSSRWKEHVLHRLEWEPFVEAFPEAAEPPAMHITITEGEAQ